MRSLVLSCALVAAAGCGGERPASPAGDEVAVSVRVVTLDPVSRTPVIVLEERAGERRLPIWIGVAEARSIAQRLEEVELPRPNTHDLAKRLVEELDGAVERVTVTELREGTYYAVIELRSAGRSVRIDSRPSDAIALALRTASPVFVREGLFEDAGGELFGPRDEGEEPSSEKEPGRRTQHRPDAPAGIGAATSRLGPGIPTRNHARAASAVART